jgi:copper chaperone NosL
MKKRQIQILSLLVGFVLLSGATSFAADDTQKHPVCSLCGMNREQFAHSRMLIAYEDGSEAGMCSLHCAAVELAVKLDQSLKATIVGDATTKKLVDAEKAFWVLGGDKPGVMTKRAKWAFQEKPDAEAFIKEHGGVLTTYEGAMKAAYEDMYADTKMIRERRKQKRQALETPKTN